jgi:hypothetical protein
MWIRARGWSVPSNPIPNRGAAFTPEQWQALDLHRGGGPSRRSTCWAPRTEPPPAGQRFMAVRGKAGIEEVTASHASMSEAAGAFTRYVGSTVLDASN